MTPGQVHDDVADVDIEWDLNFAAMERAAERSVSERQMRRRSGH